MRHILLVFVALCRVSGTALACILLEVLACRPGNKILLAQPCWHLGTEKYQNSKETSNRVSFCLEFPFRFSHSSVKSIVSHFHCWYGGFPLAMSTILTYMVVPFSRHFDSFMKPKTGKTIGTVCYLNVKESVIFITSNDIVTMETLKPEFSSAN